MTHESYRLAVAAGCPCGVVYVVTSWMDPAVVEACLGACPGVRWVGDVLLVRMGLSAWNSAAAVMGEAGVRQL